MDEGDAAMGGEGGDDEEVVVEEEDDEVGTLDARHVIIFCTLHPAPRHSQGGQ